MPVTVWRDMAKNVAESDLHKGDRVVVTGKLRTARGKLKMGQPRLITELDAAEIGPAYASTPSKASTNPTAPAALVDASRPAPTRSTNHPSKHNRDGAGPDHRGRGLTSSPAQAVRIDGSPALAPRIRDCLPAAGGFGCTDCPKSAVRAGQTAQRR